MNDAGVMDETPTNAETEPNVGASRHPATCPEDCVYRRMVFRLLVTAQFIIAATIVLLLKSAFDQIGTAAMALLGISLGVWAIVAMGRKTINISPALRSTARFVVLGPYRFVRHPMYAALLTFCGAYAISEFSWLGLQLWIGLVAIIAIKIAYEESMLKRRFPEYREYAKGVKRLIPWVF